MPKKKIDKRLLQPEKKPWKKPTEAEDWEAAGCHNNEEWHEHLKQLIEIDYTPKFSDIEI